MFTSTPIGGILMFAANFPVLALGGFFGAFAEARPPEPPDKDRPLASSKVVAEVSRAAGDWGCGRP